MPERTPLEAPGRSVRLALRNRAIRNRAQLTGTEHSRPECEWRPLSCLSHSANCVRLRGLADYCDSEAPTGATLFWKGKGGKMIELARFQQLRPVQKIAEEEARQVGLLLYPDDKLSDLANGLRDADSRTTYAALINRHREINKQNELTDLKAVNPVIASLYKWVSFKARPIRLEDFKAFSATLDPGKLLMLEDEWRLYADNLVLAIARNVLHTNYCIDFQLLIRVCYLIRLCLKVTQNGYQVGDTVTADLINDILNLPIVLPARILADRCAAHCRQPGKIDMPKADLEAVVTGRNPCECKCDESCQKPSHGCICIKPYIGDLFLIKEELARFEEGDIADIENILAGEKKVRRHRTLLHSETSTETETETVTSEERDHEVNEKFSLQSEVKSTIDEKVSVDAGVTATLKYGDSVTITPHANVTANFAKTQSQSIARSYAKDVVDRAVSKVQEKVRKLQISKVISEVEEKNLHSIDNTQPGADHRAGIYYWVNKVSHAQVYNYGKHMMFDVIVPEPAAIFKRLYQLKLEKDKNAKAPAKPTVTPQAIQRNTYGDLLNQYGIATTDEIQPPDPTVCVQVAFSQNVAEPDDNKTVAFSSNEFKVDVPAGYKAAVMDYDIRCSIGHPKSTDPDDQVAISVNVGDVNIMVEALNEFASGGGQSNKNWVSAGQRAMKGEEGSVAVAVAGFSTLALSLGGSISITCNVTDEAVEKWQTHIYNLVMADYNRKMDAYKSSDNKDDQLFQIKGRNPFLNREIERNEFKRSIIAILMCNYFNGIGSMMEKVAPCGYPEINFEKLEKDAPVIQFFEQVFEWEYMTYLFYHSMWARKCKWADLIDEDSGDPLFDKFLMSGAARVQIPIRPGLEAVFGWFLKTAQIWGASGQPPVSGDDDYVAMIQELKEADQCDYSDRPGLIEAVQGSDTLSLTKSTFYWDLVNNQPASLALDNDVDREILVNFKVYRIVKVEQANAADNSTWNITIDRPYPDASAKAMKHAVGAVFVGAPWEIVIPTELVYLRNKQDKLPVYPLSAL